MKFYTKEGKEIYFYPKEEDLISSGKQGSVFHFEDGTNIKKCIKLYFEDDEKPKSIFEDSNTVFGSDMFNFFRDKFNDPNFCTLYDLLFNESLNKTLGYTMEYYESIRENILFLPISYTLDSFSSLYDSFLSLTNNRIIVTDIHEGNVVLTKDGIKVIDYDKYRKKLEKELYAVFSINNNNLLYTFGRIYISALKSLGIDVSQAKIIQDKIDFLFSPNTTPLTLKRKMEGNAKAIDIIYRK